MTSFYRQKLVGWMLVGQFIFSGAVYAQTETLSLFEHSSADHYSIELNEGGWSCLSQYERLVLGTPASDNGHFDVSRAGRYVEGGEVGFTELLSRLLHVPIKTHLYNANTQAIEALKEEENDRLSASGFTTLLNTSSKEMDGLARRWRAEMLEHGHSLKRYRALIIQGALGLVLILLVAGGWIIHLRSLIRRLASAEETLNDQLFFKDALIDGTPHPVYVRDREGRLLHCNAGYLQAVGQTRERVIGSHVFNCLSYDQDEAQGYQDDYLQVMTDGEPLIRDRPLTLANGKRLTIYHWILPYRASNGEVHGMICGWVDISERQVLLDQLVEAKRAADEASEAKTRFLATMSHEIRTPMNAVIGMLELATKRAEQGVIDRFSLNVASETALGLLALIGDVLDIARIESGCLSLTPQRSDLRALTETVVRLFQGLAQQKNLKLLVNLDLGSNPEVLIDPLRFKQILSNLLSNAIKFTESGDVTLSLSLTAPTADHRVSLQMRVSDSGIGISDADQLRLFSPFAQANNNKVSDRSGSGLGLVICRVLCETMGGELQLRSTLGQGTTVEVGFELTSLATFGTAEPALVAPLLQAGVLNILIVDDYPASRILLSQQLTYLGHRVTDAEDGVLGLELWRNDSFDVVITDCNMPAMNGYKLASAIREEERVRQLDACLILGFTANAQAEERGKCQKAGMDDCLFKPIILADLSQYLAAIKPRAKPQGSNRVAFDTAGMNLSSLKQLAQGDRATIQRLLNDLIHSVQDDMGRLMLLYSSDDIAGLADLAHRVKGGASIVKAENLILHCEQLELACSSLDASAVAAAVDAMQQSMESLNVSLAAAALRY